MPIKSKIDWCDYTFNPIIGCKNGCDYCYAKRMNDRFRWVKKWDKPEYFEKAFDKIFKIKQPSKIFVGSLADLFGAWVPSKFIKKVIGVAEANPQHTFMFLTKNPYRYSDFDFPQNCWLGATITGQEKMRVVSARMANLVCKKYTKKNKIFLSIEPLLGSFVQYDLKHFDLVIVGAMTGPGSVVPEKEWIKSVKHKNIFYKTNIKKYL